MSKKPFVSVIVPCYNYGHFIRETIKSVEQCDAESYELIIVDDGSTEASTRDVLNTLKAEGYNVIFQENKGVAAARNTGIAAAKGEYVLPLDSDDKINPSYLPLAVEMLEKNPEIGVVYGRAEFFGSKQGEWKLPAYETERLLIYNYIYVSAVYRKKIWEACGGYDTDQQIDGWEDWDFWISVAEKGWKFVQLDEIVFHYRIHEASKMEPHRAKEQVPVEIQRYIISKHSEFYRGHFVKMYENARVFGYWKNNPLRGIARLSVIKLKALVDYKK